MISFDDWYQEIEGFGLRAERLTAPTDELRAAFEAGQQAAKIDVNQLLFNVNDDNSVSLWLGPISVIVCQDPEDFGDFVDRLVRRLNTIGDEICEEYHEEKRRNSVE